MYGDNLRDYLGGDRYPITIHFMWYDMHDPNCTTYSIKYKKYIDSWKKYNPNCIYKFWYNREIENLWTLAPEKYINQYNKMRHIEKCDFTRYWILYLFGGVYVDLNTMCYKDIRPLVFDKNNTPRKLGLAFEPSEHFSMSGYGSLITNSFLVSQPHNPFWIQFMDYICENYWPSNDTIEFVLINTGPAALARFTLKYYNDQLDDIMIDTCLVQKFINKSRGNNVSTRGCEDIEPYISKHWKDTAGWGVQHKNKKYIFWIMLILFILLGLFFFYQSYHQSYHQS